jgi:hypothetical protein
MLILSVALRVLDSESKAWPIARAVVTRLGTDEGARDLYAKNPRLAENYASADAFLETMRAKRVALGSLPEREPPGDGRGYRVESDPGGLRVFTRGGGGAWMLLEVERSDGTEAGHSAIGEGITFLGFADSEASLHDVRQTARGAFNELQWSRFKTVEEALLTDAGTRALLEANPTFIKDDAAREAFLHQAQSWRVRLVEKPPPATWKEVEGAKDERVELYRRSGAPFGDHMVLGWQLKSGDWLKVEWNDGRLAKITLGT